MPAILNWFLRLIVTNPICMRLIQGGSRRQRHMFIRSGYLLAMGALLILTLLNSSSRVLSLGDLAKAGASTFTWISYLQLGLICLLTPVFMAGAIAQEANPRTWDILLTSPLNNLQIVLGNLFGRLFFVLALLFSTLPLFVTTQFFGGVPGDSIFASYAIAGASSLLVAAIAVTLSVTRTAGRRAVFLFYVTVVMYLFLTFAIDVQLRTPAASIAVGAQYTTIVTPLNPFLALMVLLSSNTYVPLPLAETEASWLARTWYTSPIATFCWLCVLISLALVAFSTLRLRVIGAKTGSVPWYRRLFGLGAKGAVERPARHVGHNPIAWREASARGKTLGAITARWGFVLLGTAVALVLIGLFHAGIWTGADLRLAVAAVVGAEIVIIALTAINMSATAVSREREDGTLDLILTTPIQPGAYLTGKLRGLVQFVLPMILVPAITMLIIAVYMLSDGFGKGGGVMMTDPNPLGTGAFPPVPAILPEGVIALPLTLTAFTAFCVMVGLQWSIKSRGTIGSVIAAVTIIGVVGGVLGLCGMAAGEHIPVLGAAINALSPINLLWSLVNPAEAVTKSMQTGVTEARISIVIGSVIAVIVYAVAVYLMHTNMKRTFMMTVRRLAGAN